MMRKAIKTNTERNLYAESMGRCMNPDCQKELLHNNQTTAERAHIIPYSKTVDNSLENLIILCPTCHTAYDKNLLGSTEDLRTWKQIRQEEVSKFFSKKFNTFEKLEEIVKPILTENKTIYEEYFVQDEPKLWKKFEGKILINNNKLKVLLENNTKLIQCHQTKGEYSNLKYVNQFLLHIEEFKQTRPDEEKTRLVLFPKIINSIFGVSPVSESSIPSVLSLECLIQKMINEGHTIHCYLDKEPPYLDFIKDDKNESLFLLDTPRLRQLYFKYNCFKNTELRLKSLFFILKWLKNNNIAYDFNKLPSVSTVIIKNKKFLFVCEYCLSSQNLQSIAPESGISIVNLHNFNADSCISEEAYSLAKDMGIALFTSSDFYKHAHNELK